ncbi:MAG TPA: hypothetical protein VGG76_12375 [Gemmatimonadaceae bacterium]
MTDEPKTGRLDLRALEDGDRARGADEIIRRAILGSARMRGALADDDPRDLRRYLRPAMLAAGILVVIAVGTVRTTRYQRRTPSPITSIAGWTETHHLPSNGELWVAFQGYGQ